MQLEELGGGGPLTPLDLRKIAPIDAAAAGDRLGWVGLEADRYCESPAFDFNPPAITHHRLVLYTRPPEQLDLLYEGVKRHVPPPAGAISLVPAGNPHRVRSSGCKGAGGQLDAYRRARRLLGPERVLSSLQASRRRHAATVPDDRKNRLKAANPWKKLQSAPLTIAHEQRIGARVETSAGRF